MGYRSAALWKALLGRMLPPVDQPCTTSASLVQAYGLVSPTTAMSPPDPIANAHALSAQLTLTAALVQFRANCNDSLFANIVPPVSTQTGGQEN